MTKTDLSFGSVVVIQISFGIIFGIILFPGELIKVVGLCVFADLFTFAVAVAHYVFRRIK